MRYALVMRNILLVLAMLISHIVCPFQCMGQHAAAQESVAPTRCHCCSHPASETNDPLAPQDDEVRCDCICQGATLSEHFTLPPASEVSAFIATGFSLTADRFAVTTQVNDDSPPRAPLGRTFHLALHSLVV